MTIKGPTATFPPNTIVAFCGDFTCLRAIQEAYRAGVAYGVAHPDDKPERNVRNDIHDTVAPPYVKERLMLNEYGRRCFDAGYDSASQDKPAPTPISVQPWRQGAHDERCRCGECKAHA